MAAAKKTVTAAKDLKIKITNLHKKFGEKVVLDGIDLEIARGESLVIIGGSGTGKSVLIKCILGVVEPDSGSILIDDVESTTYNRDQREKFMAKIGMLFQGGALFDSLPIWENITFRLLNREKISRAKAKEVAAESLAEVGLGRDVLPLSPSELSGGMQKRVALARAIAAKPEIIFFDEPTTGLDPIMSDVINDLIVKSSKKLGATTIAITHDMASVRKIADKVAMIHKGKIVWFGSVNDIDKTDNEYVVQFINGRAEGPIQMDLKK